MKLHNKIQENSGIYIEARSAVFILYYTLIQLYNIAV